MRSKIPEGEISSGPHSIFSLFFGTSPPVREGFFKRVSFLLLTSPKEEGE